MTPAAQGARVSDERLARNIRLQAAGMTAHDDVAADIALDLRDARARIAAWEPVVREAVKGASADRKCCALCASVCALPPEMRP